MWLKIFRSPWIMHVDPKSNDKCLYKSEAVEDYTDRREGSKVTTGTDVVMTLSQAQGQLPEAGRGKNRFPFRTSSPQREDGPTWLLTSSLQNYANKSMSFKPWVYNNFLQKPWEVDTLVLVYIPPSFLQSCSAILSMGLRPHAHEWLLHLYRVHVPGREKKEHRERHG